MKTQAAIFDKHFKVGEWLVNPFTNTVTSPESSTRLEHKTMQVLLCLAENAGEVVPKETLMQTVWADTAVTDHVLNVAISALRKALGDDAQQPRFIQTVPRTGYRLIAPVSPIDEVVAPIETAPPLQSPATPKQNRKIVWIAAVAIFILLLSFISLRWWRSASADKAQPQPITIAVLPLQNLSGNPEQEYFADGLTEALITDLAKLGQVRVISRTSVMPYKTVKKPLPEIARELRAKAIVEGSVLNSDGRVRISVQLVDAATDQHLWAESYERNLTNVIGLQREVAQAIAQRISGKLAAPAIAPTLTTVSPMAYEAYLKGRFFWHKRTNDAFAKALQYFEEAIKQEPNFALAYTGLADCYTTSGGAGLGLSRQQAFDKAKEAVAKALQLDPQLAEAHTSLAGIKFYYDWDWPEAEKEFRQAIALSPSNTSAHQWYAEYLAAMGRAEEATNQMLEASWLDPLSPSINYDLAWIYYLARQYDKALTRINKLLELDSNNQNAYALLYDIYERQGLSDKAAEALRKTLPARGFSAAELAAFDQAYKRDGMKGLHQWRLQNENRLVGGVSHGWRASVYAELGETEKAFQELEQAMTGRDGALPWLKVSPKYDALKSDPRFNDVCRRLRL